MNRIVIVSGFKRGRGGREERTRASPSAASAFLDAVSSRIKFFVIFIMKRRKIRVQTRLNPIFFILLILKLRAMYFAEKTFVSFALGMIFYCISCLATLHCLKPSILPPTFARQCSAR